MELIVIIVFIVLIIGVYKLTRVTTSASKEAWQQFAEANNLCFKLRRIYYDEPFLSLNLWRIYDDESFDDEPIIDGDFHGYSLSISSQRDLEYGLNTIFVLKRNKTLNYFEKHQTDRDIIRRFLAVYNIIKSGIGLEITSERIVFRSGLIKSTDKLQSISEQLANFIEIFSEICKIGGEAVDSLLQVKTSTPITWHIIDSICVETVQRIRPKIPLLLCKKCNTFYSSHKIKSPISLQFYYGCRICRQSRNFIEGRSIAILDNQMTEKWSVQENEISVNWLTFHKPFDFHEVRIMQASDREVEEFVMQVGNDTDEFRQPRYKKIPCIISSGCKLSTNTRNILKHTFKSVKEM